MVPRSLGVLVVVLALTRLSSHTELLQVVSVSKIPLLLGHLDAVTVSVPRVVRVLLTSVLRQVQSLLLLVRHALDSLVVLLHVLRLGSRIQVSLTGSLLLRRGHLVALVTLLLALLRRLEPLRLLSLLLLLLRSVRLEEADNTVLHVTEGATNLVAKSHFIVRLLLVALREA